MMFAEKFNSIQSKKKRNQEAIFPEILKNSFVALQKVFILLSGIGKGSLYFFSKEVAYWKDLKVICLYFFYTVSYACSFELTLSI